MTNYEVKSTDSKHFVVTSNGEPKGSLAYDSWFSFKADIQLASQGALYAVPKGFWGTTVEIKQNDAVILSFKMHWDGNIIIKSFFPEQSATEYLFKYKGILKSSFILLDPKEKLLMEVKPDFSFRKFNYDYAITTTDEFDKIEQNKILLLATVHCSNYFMSIMTAVMVTAM